MPQIFQTVQISRPTYLDRNPIVALSAFGLGGVGPHTATTRVSYTCPASKKTWIDSLWIDAIRSAASGAPGNMFIRVAFTPALASPGFLLQQFQNQGVINVDSQSMIQQVGFISVGDNISVTTSDASVGGAYDYNAGFKHTEFDQ